MKKLLLFIVACAFSASLLAQEASPREVLINDSDSSYYMKRYIMCFLTMGQHRNMTKKEADKVQSAHIHHVKLLSKKGVITMSGLFPDAFEIREILLFDLENIEEAKAYAELDPAVQSGMLGAEFHAWWAVKGSALH